MKFLHRVGGNILLLSCCFWEGAVLGNAQRVGGYEFAIDAPWRIEMRPQIDGSMGWGNIPVYINFSDIDALDIHGNYCPGGASTLEKVIAICKDAKPLKVNKVQVFQRDDVTWSQLSVQERQSFNPWVLKQTVDNGVEAEFWHEIEVSRGVWQDNTPLAFGSFDETQIASANNSGVNNELCQSHKSQSPCSERFMSLARVSEWHGLSYFTPDLSLLEAASSNELLKVKLKVVAYVDSLDDDGAFHKNSRYISYLTVNLGQKLPKFDHQAGSTQAETSLSQWAYGDLHFHSQGTDNTGEMGYSYRSALQAMNAMGLDFAIASDHASNNKQVSFINVAEGRSFLDQIIFDPFRDLASFLAIDVRGWTIDWLEDPELFGVGDMTPTRWSNHWYLLNGQSNNSITQRAGANLASERVFDNYLSTQSNLNIPTLILGGEVDAAPETDFNDIQNNIIGVVKDAKYDFNRACIDLPNDPLSETLIGDYDSIKELLVDHGYPFSFPYHDRDINDPEESICSQEKLAVRVSMVPERYILKDVQAKTLEPGRQHFIHIPSNPNDPNAGIMSDTNDFGGASKRLIDHINNDYEAGNKGYFFLAHPANMPSGTGQGRLGPDGYPYSKVQLQDAMKSRFFLGLQAWNENDHFKSRIESDVSTDYSPACETEDCQAETYFKQGATYRPARRVFAEGAEKIEREFCGSLSEIENLLRDLPYQHTVTRNIHVCDKNIEGTIVKWTEDDKLLSFDFENETSNDIKRMVRGAELLDTLNMWGLDRDFTRTIEWLQEDEPRRVWFAGGSDSHGDWNHRRHGYAFGVSDISDSAIGTPRNLVKVGMPSGNSAEHNGKQGTAYSHEQILNGLMSGNFVVTDGPILRIVVDKNKNGVIDDDDVEMGDYIPDHDCLEVDLLVEWRSTPEFGGVEEINLVVGAFDNLIHQRGFRFVPRGFSSSDHTVDNIPSICVDVSDISGQCNYLNLDSDNDRRSSSEENIDRLTNSTIDSKHIIRPEQSEQFYGLKAVTLNISDYKIFQYNAINGNGIAARNPDRLFIRAVASTEFRIDSSENKWRSETGLSGQCSSKNRDCVARFAYTNPIFINVKNSGQGE